MVWMGLSFMMIFWGISNYSHFKPISPEGTSSKKVEVVKTEKELPKVSSVTVEKIPVPYSPHNIYEIRKTSKGKIIVLPGKASMFENGKHGGNGNSHRKGIKGWSSPVKLFSNTNYIDVPSAYNGSPVFGEVSNGLIATGWLKRYSGDSSLVFVDKSTNGGNSWSRVFGVYPDCWKPSIATWGDTVFLVFSYETMWVFTFSTDGGNSWWDTLLIFSFGSATYQPYIANWKDTLLVTFEYVLNGKNQIVLGYSTDGGRDWVGWWIISDTSTTNWTPQVKVVPGKDHTGWWWFGSVIWDEEWDVLHGYIVWEGLLNGTTRNQLWFYKILIDPSQDNPMGYHILLIDPGPITNTSTCEWVNSFCIDNASNYVDYAQSTSPELMAFYNEINIGDIHYPLKMKTYVFFHYWDNWYGFIGEYSVNSSTLADTLIGGDLYHHINIYADYNIDDDFVLVAWDMIKDSNGVFEQHPAVMVSSNGGNSWSSITTFEDTFKKWPWDLHPCVYVKDQNVYYIYYPQKDSFGYSDLVVRYYENIKPSIPFPIAPSNGYVLSSTKSKIKFIWNHSEDFGPAGLYGYNVKIWKDKITQTPLIDIFVQDTTFEISLKESGKYLWTVEAIDNVGNVSSSGIIEFYLNPSSNIVENKYEETVYDIKLPSIIRSSKNIIFSKNKFIVEVYNISGRKLFSQKANKLEINKLGSGYYFIIIKNPDNPKEKVKFRIFVLKD